MGFEGEGSHLQSLPPFGISVRRIRKVVLHLGQLESVPLDASEKVYSSMLRPVDEEAELGQLEDAPSQANPQAHLPIISYVGEDFSLPAPKRRRGQRARPKERAKRDWVSTLCPSLHDAEAGQDHQGQAVGQQEEMLPLADAPLVEAGQASSASTGQPGQPNLPGQQGGAGQQLNRDNNGPRILEGVKVKVNKHGVLGQPGSYERVVGKCPKCKVERQRSFSVNLENGLGELEPYAYVGVWLRRRRGFASPDEHKAYKPSPAEVEEYAETVLM